MDIDISVVFRLRGRVFECFHGHVQAEQADRLYDVRRKIVRCVERDLFPDEANAVRVITPSRVRACVASRYVLAFVLVGLMTGLLALIQVTAPRNMPSLLYMVAILASAVALGRGPSLLASVAAFIENVTLENDLQFALRAYEFAPLPEDWVRLSIFVAAALAASVGGPYGARQT